MKTLRVLARVLLFAFAAEPDQFGTLYCHVAGWKP